MNQVNLITNLVSWQPVDMQFEELSQFEMSLLIAHFYKHKMYPKSEWGGKSDLYKPEQSSKGACKEVLVPKQRNSISLGVICTTQEEKQW